MSSFCSACGASVPPGAGFCTACGRTVEPPGMAPGAPAFALSPTTASPPPGRVQEPGMAALLSAITLTVYFYVWLWRVSTETDAYGRRATPARPLALAAIVLAVASLASGIAVFVTLGMRAFAEAMRGGSAPTIQIPAYLQLLTLVSVAAHVAAAFALSRVWAVLAVDAVAHGRTPVNGGNLLLLSLVAPAGSTLGTLLSLVPGAGAALASLASLATLVGYVLWVVVVHRTQAELNAAWTAASQRPAGETTPA